VTAFNPALGEQAESAREERSFRLAPSEGWLVVGLLFLMLAMFARAVDDANWAGVAANGRSATSFMNWAVLLGGLYGLVAAKTRLPPLAVHLLGAILATAFLIVAVAGTISTAESLPGRIDALLLSLGRFYHDLIIEGIRSREISAFLLVLGAVGWTTGHFAAFNLFRRHRVLDTVLITGLAMLAQVSLTIEAQYSYLVVFVAAALLLVVRMNLLEQRTGWARRRIGDWGDVSNLYMRSGLAFVLTAMVGSIALAATASSAPLASAWRDADSDLVRLGAELNRIVGGVTGVARGPTGLFGTSQTIRGFWDSTSRTVVFRAATSDGEGRYWRAATYDAFDGYTWLQVDRDTGIQIAPGDALLEVTAEALPADRSGRADVSATVVGVDYSGDILLAPDAPLSVDRPANVYASEPGRPLVGIELADDLATGDAYTVQASVRVEGEEAGGLTENKLAAAGVSYPGWVERYIDIREGSIGEPTFAVAEDIVARLPEDGRDPYHVAAAIQAYLYSSGGFDYRTDVRGLCGNEPIVDCFMRTKAGYCEYFATAMVMLLRTQEIPARMVLGYLPGRQLDDGTWQVDRSAAHAWVEVYFPGYGWVQFDPTPGNSENQQRPTLLEPGAPVPTPAAGAFPSPSFLPNDNPIDPQERRQPSAAPSGTTSTDLRLPLGIMIGLVVLAVILGAVARRRWQEATEPDVAFQGMARQAGRFGYGPRPTETAYEYAGALGELVPAVRDDLHTVAVAKVETTYARRRPAADILAALGRAYRRVRIGLLALALRRAGRGRLGRPDSTRTRLRR
jgi:hypothetical protein